MNSTRSVLACAAVAAPASVAAQDSVDALIDRAVTPLSDALSAAIFYEIPIPFVDQGIPFIVLWLVFAGLFFTFYFGFINLRALKHAFKLVRGDFTPPEAAGEVTHFQALATALSGTGKTFALAQDQEMPAVAARTAPPPASLMKDLLCMCVPSD